MEKRKAENQIKEAKKSEKKKIKNIREKEETYIEKEWENKGKKIKKVDSPLELYEFTRRKKNGEAFFDRTKG